VTWLVIASRLRLSHGVVFLQGKARAHGDTSLRARATELGRMRRRRRRRRRKRRRAGSW
jgi:hypothetical protein